MTEQTQTMSATVPSYDSPDKLQMRPCRTCKSSLSIHDEPYDMCNIERRGDLFEPNTIRTMTLRPPSKITPRKFTPLLDALNLACIFLPTITMDSSATSTAPVATTDFPTEGAHTQASDTPTAPCTAARHDETESRPQNSPTSPNFPLVDHKSALAIDSAHHEDVSPPDGSGNDRVTGNPSPYKEVAPSGKTPEGKYRVMTVSKLDFFAPSEGLTYLHDRLKVFNHDHFLVCGFSYYGPQPILTYRFHKATWHTLKAGFKQIIMDMKGEAVDSGPHDKLGPDEVERSFRPREYDWTRDWDFILFMRNFNRSGEGWMADACLYFRGLSPDDCGAIPWNNASRTKRVPGPPLPVSSPRLDNRNSLVRFTWKFCERSDSPRWGASFAVYYVQGGPLARGAGLQGPIASLEDPWEFFDSTYTRW